jgi:hypothetical protein
MKFLSKFIIFGFIAVLNLSNINAQEFQIYSSQYAIWFVYDTNFYKQYKTNVDSIIHVLDRGIPGIIKRLGITPKLPIKVHIEQGSGGFGGWAGGGEVGYTSTCFTSNAGMSWVKGVVIGECVNVTTGVVTANWPVDWWVDGVWYFPGFVVVDVLKEACDTASAKKWETDEKYPTYPVYNAFNSLLKEFGWSYYQNFFKLIIADTMSWSKIGANPSKIKTNYVLAYMSLAAGRNLGPMFKNANVQDADSTEIEAIMSVEKRLRLALSQKINVASAFTDFRNGNYPSAKTKLDNLGITYIKLFANKNIKISKENILQKIKAYTLNGQYICNIDNDLSNINKLQNKYANQPVIIKFIYKNKKEINIKYILHNN